MAKRRMGLKAKFVAALTIAALLPLAAGTFVLQSLSYRHRLDERGRLHQAEAIATSRLLDQALDAEAERLRGWLAADTVLPARWREANARAATLDPESLRQQTSAIESTWQSGDESDAILRHPSSERLRDFRKLSPKVAEIFITDRFGRVIASSNVTSDYDQADESWWQQGGASPVGVVWCDALQYDASAQVYSVDLVMAAGAGDQVEAVVKMVVDVTPLLASLRRPEHATEREIILADGKVLTRLGCETRHIERVDDAVMRRIKHADNGWLFDPKQGGWMTGFAPFAKPNGHGGGGYVLISSPRDEVIAPVRNNIVKMTLGSCVVVGLCGIAGYCYARRRILHPLATLGKAARSLAASARLDAGISTAKSSAARREAEASLAQLDGIHSGDEIEHLARDFSVMSERVLRYHRQLEEDVEAKTAVIRADLEMAREFQHALLPNEYPEVPLPGSNDSLRLSFAHFYQAAATVGGDFFDLIRIDDHRAGVFIADVMGHGARSALVTAILRALVHNGTPRVTSPGDFLTELNGHFHDMVARSGHTLFVTAFFMILDTKRQKLSWAVAGHPAPLRLRDGKAEPLWQDAQRQPALGLVPRIPYTSHEEPLHADERFLLFTDGLIEAENAASEQFGIERLIELFATTGHINTAAVPSAIVDELFRYQDKDTMDDDLCLLVVDIAAVD